MVEDCLQHGLQSFHSAQFIWRYNEDIQNMGNEDEEMLLQKYNYVCIVFPPVMQGMLKLNQSKKKTDLCTSSYQTVGRKKSLKQW